MSEPVSLGEHFRELRTRLLICVVALLIGAAVAFYFYLDIFEFLIRPAREVAGGDGFRPIYTEVTELLGTTVRVSLLGGFVLALPVILYNAIRFVAPGLTPHERRILFSFLPAALLAFVGGMAFGYFVMIPPALKFLLTFGGDVAEPLIRISNLISNYAAAAVLAGHFFRNSLGYVRIGYPGHRAGWRFRPVPPPLAGGIFRNRRRHHAHH